MGTSIATVGPRDVYPATVEQFGSAEVIFVQFGGLYNKICLASVEQALPGVERTAEWQRFIGSQEIIYISVNGSKPFSARVISKADFFNAALSHPKYSDFRAKVAKMLERLDNVGVVVASDVPKTPLIQSLQSQLELAIRQEKQAIEQARQGRAIEVVKGRADDAYNLAETSIELQTKFRGRLICIAELGRRGWRLPQSIWAKVGMECRAISLRLGDDPANFKRPWNGMDVNTYREDVFDLWETEYGPALSTVPESAVIPDGGN